MFNMSAILLDDTFWTSSPFSDTAVNKNSARHSSTIAFSAVSRFQTVIAIHSLLQGSPHRIIYRV